MKRLRASAAFLFALLSGAIIASAETETQGFLGVQKSMSPKAFQEAGLNKLTPEELARLDEFIRRYAASSNQEAASAAVNRAVKENKVSSQPQVIESRIVGP